jgi:hypothetical protein
VDNIKMDLKEVGWDGMDWMDKMLGSSRVAAQLPASQEGLSFMSE